MRRRRAEQRDGSRNRRPRVECLEVTYLEPSLMYGGLLMRPLRRFRAYCPTVRTRSIRRCRCPTSFVKTPRSRSSFASWTSARRPLPNAPGSRPLGRT
jgi:hypothetical protein